MKYTSLKNLKPVELALKSEVTKIVRKANKKAETKHMTIIGSFTDMKINEMGFQKIEYQLQDFETEKLTNVSLVICVWDRRKSFVM